MEKRWYKSKTVWLGILSILIAVLEFIATFLASGDFSPTAIVLGVSGLLGIVLRFLTSEPIA